MNASLFGYDIVSPAYACYYRLDTITSASSYKKMLSIFIYVYMVTNGYLFCCVKLRRPQYHQAGISRTVGILFIERISDAVPSIIEELRRISQVIFIIGPLLPFFLFGFIR